MATTSVPLMSDIEGGESEERPSDIKNDFSYHNNVAGAPAMIRKGFLKKVSCSYKHTHQSEKWNYKDLR